MKRAILFQPTNSFLFVLFSCFILIGNIQTKATEHAKFSNYDDEKRSLLVVLEEFKQIYQIYFSYDTELIKNTEVNFEPKATEIFEDAINRLLAETNLQYERISEKYFIIYPKNRMGIKSIKNKLRKIRELGEKGNFELQRNHNGTGQNIKRLQQTLEKNLASITISGVVAYADSNDPLIGVNVVVEGTTIGTTTNANGYYRLTVGNDVTENFNLIFSYLGYSSQSMALTKLNGDITQNVNLYEDPLVLQGVVVNARKRAENTQDVPMSITTLDNLYLRRSNTTDFQDFAVSIPNLSFGPQGGGGVGDGLFSNQISIRGITGFNTTGFYIDELPLPENISPKLIDVARVEVLRGPQGTLYGSSSMGGAVKVITNQPDPKELDTNINVAFSSQAEGDPIYGIDGMLNLPIAKDKVALRVVGFYNQRGGIFDKNVVGTLGTSVLSDKVFESVENLDKEETFGFHASLGFKPNDKITIVPKIIYQSVKGDGYPFADISVDKFEQERHVGNLENYENDLIQYSLTANAHLKRGSITSATSYIDWKYEENEDATEFIAAAFEIPFFYSAPINRPVDYSRFVEELRYTSDWSGKLQFIGGLFYSNESYKPAYTQILPGFGNTLDPENLGSAFDNLFVQTGFTDIDEFALFGELAYQISDKFSVTGGLRYFNANQHRFRSSYGAVIGVFDPAKPQIQDGKLDESGVNPKLSLSYKPSSGNVLYATVVKGFRLGGVNETAPESFCRDELKALGISSTSNFASDALWNYEIGAKTTLANGKVFLNASVFYIDWQDIQQRRQLTCGFPFIGNVGAASSTGLELELHAKPVSGFNLGLGMGYVNAKVTKSDRTLDAEVNDRIQQVPQITANGFAQYSITMSNDNILYFRGDFQSIGESFTSFDQNDKARTKAAFTLLNFKVGYGFPNWEISLFADNLTNEHANFGDVVALAAELPGRPRYTTNRPRQLGIGLSWNL